MTDDAGQRAELAHGLAGVRVARICCAVVALLLVAAIVYGALMAIGNYAELAV